MPRRDIAQGTCKVCIYSSLIQCHHLVASFRLYPGEKLWMEQKWGKPFLTRNPGDACEHWRETRVFDIHPQLQTRVLCLLCSCAPCSARQRKGPGIVSPQLEV